MLRRPIPIILKFLLNYLNFFKGMSFNIFILKSSTKTTTLVLNLSGDQVCLCSDPGPHCALEAHFMCAFAG